MGFLSSLEPNDSNVDWVVEDRPWFRPFYMGVQPAAELWVELIGRVADCEY